MLDSIVASRCKLSCNPVKPAIEICLTVLWPPGANCPVVQWNELARVWPQVQERGWTFSVPQSRCLCSLTSTCCTFLSAASSAWRLLCSLKTLFCLSDSPPFSGKRPGSMETQVPHIETQVPHVETQVPHAISMAFRLVTVGILIERGKTWSSYLKQINLHLIKGPETRIVISFPNVLSCC